MIRWISLFSLVAVLGCGGSSSGGGGSSGGAGGVERVEPGPTCIDLCQKVIGECEAFSGTEEDCRQACQRNLDAEYAVDEACGAAAEDVFACAIELDCQAVYDWRDQQPTGGFPCRDRVLVFDELIDQGICAPAD